VWRDNHPYILALTHSLTHSWSWDLLEMLSIVQPLKNFPAFYKTRWFITVFTRALHWSLIWARSIQSIKSYLSKIHLNIVHPPTSWSSQWSLSFRHSHQYPIYIILLPIRTTCPAHHTLLYKQKIIFLCGQYIEPRGYVENRNIKCTKVDKTKDKRIQCWSCIN
jgi:hypothetical protein